MASRRVGLPVEAAVGAVGDGVVGECDIAGIKLHTVLTPVDGVPRYDYFFGGEIIVCKDSLAAILKLIAGYFDK